MASKNPSEDPRPSWNIFGINFGVFVGACGRYFCDLLMYVLRVFDLDGSRGAWVIASRAWGCPGKGFGEGFPLIPLRGFRSNSRPVCNPTRSFGTVSSISFCSSEEASWENTFGVICWAICCACQAVATGDKCCMHVINSKISTTHTHTKTGLASAQQNTQHVYMFAQFSLLCMCYCLNVLLFSEFKIMSCLTTSPLRITSLSIGSFWGTLWGSFCNCRHPGPGRVWDGGPEPRVLPPLPWNP